MVRSARTGSPSEVRRQRRRYAVAGVAAAVVVLGVVGVALWKGSGRDEVETGPAAVHRRGTTALEPARAATEVCTADLSDAGRVYELTIPAGWFANEAVEAPDGSASGRVAACSQFGPHPVRLRDYEPEWGWESNAVVSVLVSPSGPATFDDLVASKEADPGAVSAQRTSVDGRAAARIEKVDRLDGRRYAQWVVDVDDQAETNGYVVYVSTGHNDVLSYTESVAALDAIATSLRVRAGP